MNNQIYNKVIKENICIHNQEADHYDKIHSDGNNFAQKMRANRFINKIFDTKKPEDTEVLDLGCGTGFLVLNFALRNCRSCTGVDVSKRMIEQLDDKIKKMRLANIKTVCEEINIYLDNCGISFDVISFSSVLHHLPNYKETLKKIIPLVKKNGYVYITREPLKQKPDSRIRFILHRVIANIDRILHGIILAIKGLKPLPVKYGYAHYQQEKHGGVDQNYLMEFFQKNGFEIILFEKYCVRFLGIFSLIATKIIKSENDFQILAKKLQ